jgi:GTPase SAR1 family protein
VGFWDLGGKDSVRPLWPSFYRNIVFSGVIFVVETFNFDRVLEAKRELHFLVNEEELREAVFLIILNLRNDELNEHIPLGQQPDINFVDADGVMLDDFEDLDDLPSGSIENEGSDDR